MTLEGRLNKILNNNIAAMKHNVVFTTVYDPLLKENKTQIQIDRYILRTTVKTHWLYVHKITFTRVSSYEWRAELYDVKSNRSTIEIVSDKFVQKFMIIIKKGENYHEITETLQ